MVVNLEPVSYITVGRLVVGQLRITKGADVQVECDEPTLNTTQQNYVIHTKGSLTCYGPNGEVVGSRTAGETTDTSSFIWPAGITTAKANTDEYEYLCLYKIDETPVVREEHHLTDGQELTITNQTKVLVVISGAVSLNGLDFTGPEVIQIKSPSVRLVSIGDSFVSKVS